MVFISLFPKFCQNILYANSRDPDQTPHCRAFDLCLQCLHMAHKKDSRLIWHAKPLVRALRDKK